VVFSKCTGEIIAFVDFGEQWLDKELRRRCKRDSWIDERIVATHMLVLMVQGIYFKMDIPIAQFPNTGLHTIPISECIKYAGVSADNLVGRLLLSLSGLQVCSVLYVISNC